jgi:hypothetical protein
MPCFVGLFFRLLSVHGMRVGLQDRGLRTGLLPTMRANQNYIGIMGELRNPVTGQTQHVDKSRTMLALGYEIEAHGTLLIMRVR